MHNLSLMDKLVHAQDARFRQRSKRLDWGNAFAPGEREEMEARQRQQRTAPVKGRAKRGWRPVRLIDFIRAWIRSSQGG